MHRILLLLVVLFHTICLKAQKDTVYLKNNTVLVGELRSFKMGKAEFDGDGIGIVNIKYDQIKTWYAQSNLFRVETTNRKLLFGKMVPSKNNGETIIKNGMSILPLKFGNITNLSAVGETVSKRIEGNIGAGYTYTKSSEIGRLNMNTKVGYRTTNVETMLIGDLILTTDSAQSYRERENLRLTSFYYFNQKWMAGGILNYQRNIQLGLLSRWQSGVAGGIKLLQKQNSRATILTGFVLNKELNSSQVSNTLSEITLQATYDFFSFDKPNLSLSVMQKLYSGISQSGRIRSDGDIKLGWELFNDFSLSLNYFYNYDSKSPATNTPRTDFGFVAGIAYSF
jgi:hypothetical protein